VRGGRCWHFRSSISYHAAIALGAAGKLDDTAALMMHQVPVAEIERAFTPGTDQVKAGGHMGEQAVIDP
jgi:hypothetical protein